MAAAGDESLGQLAIDPEVTVIIFFIFFLKHVIFDKKNTYDILYYYTT